MNKRQIENERYAVNKFNEYKEFIKDKQVSFVIRKTERIVYGVYMLSKFIPSDEVLLLDLKKTSHLVLEIVSRFATASHNITSTDIGLAHSHLQYLSSLLSLSFISGFVSGSNIEIMKSEINYLHKHIEELSTRFASETGQLQLKSDLFVIGQHKVEPRPRPEMSFTKESSSTDESKMSFKKNPIVAREKPPVVVKPTDTARSIESKDDREKRILDVIQDKRVVSIKDISSVIFDVSEKTIQRTLQLLIDKGQIKKEGERRWAKYQLV